MRPHTPLKTSALTPLGRKPPMGTTNQSWTNLTAGTPEASKFDIQGVAMCKLSSHCKSEERQAQRLALGQLYNAARYLDADA